MNLKKKIFDEMIDSKSDDDDDDDPVFSERSIKYAGDVETEKQWKKLQDDGMIPQEISNVLKNAGLKSQKPFLEHYKNFNTLVDNGLQFGHQPITSEEYKRKFMDNDDTFSNLSEPMEDNT